MDGTLQTNNSPEQEKVQAKNHLLETLLIIAGFAIATYSNPQGKTTVMSAVFGISIYAFILFDLFIIGWSTVSKSDGWSQDVDMDEFYLPLVITFSSMLLLYFFSLGTFTVDNEFLIRVLPNLGEYIYQFWTISYFFTTVSILSCMLFFALSSRFAKSLKMLSTKYKIGSIIVFYTLIVISNIKLIFAIIMLSLLVLTIIALSYFFGKLPYAFKRICLICIIVSLTAMVLNLGGSLSQPQPEVIHGSLDITVENVNLASNNTSVHLQNCTLVLDNVSATIYR